jgi:membrane-associated protease RseP (regulator of RpoE activity)
VKPTIVAVVACVVLIAISELARIAVTRAVGHSRGGRVAAPLIGMVAAYVAVAALAFVFYRAYGVPTQFLEVHVKTVENGYPATGKLEKGDRIVAIDGVPLTKSLSLMVDERGGKPVTLTLVRRGAQLDITLTPIGHDGHWMLGFRPAIARATNRDTGLALERAVVFPIEQTKQLIPDRRETVEAAGPVRIVEEYAASEPAGLAELRRALVFSTYVLLLLVALDLVRVVLALRARPDA